MQHSTTIENSPQNLPNDSTGVESVFQLSSSAKATCRYLKPPQMSLELRLEVSFEKSPRSMQA